MKTLPSRQNPNSFDVGWLICFKERASSRCFGSNVNRKS
jgi:hypothetical protein